MRKSATVAITSFLSFPLLLGFDVFRVAARLISGVRDAAGGIELRESSSEALSRRESGGTLRTGSDELFRKRRVAHIEEFTRLIQLPAGFADIPIPRELVKHPRARSAFLAPDLGGKTLAVEPGTSTMSFA